MDKKNYQKPSMKVVKLTHAPLLQSASKPNVYLSPIDADMNHKA